MQTLSSWKIKARDTLIRIILAGVLAAPNYGMAKYFDSKIKPVTDVEDYGAYFISRNIDEMQKYTEQAKYHLQEHGPWGDRTFIHVDKAQYCMEEAKKEFAWNNDTTYTYQESIRRQFETIDSILDVLQNSPTNLRKFSGDNVYKLEEECKKALPSLDSLMKLYDQQLQEPAVKNANDNIFRFPMCRLLSGLCKVAMVCFPLGYLGHQAYLYSRVKKADARKEEQTI